MRKDIRQHPRGDRRQIGGERDDAEVRPAAAAVCAPCATAAEQPCVGQVGHDEAGHGEDFLGGAGYGVRSEDRVNSRSGYRARDWDSWVGTMELAIPTLRSGWYFPCWPLGRPQRSGR